MLCGCSCHSFFKHLCWNNVKKRNKPGSRDHYYRVSGCSPDPKDTSTSNPYLKLSIGLISSHCAKHMRSPLIEQANIPPKKIKLTKAQVTFCIFFHRVLVLRLQVVSPWMVYHCTLIKNLHCMVVILNWMQPQNVWYKHWHFKKYQLDCRCSAYG